ncbi:hypothetical protein CG716_19470 [Mycolicibacterium sphagni]|uniref:Uncharacterized protein n=1 Tax=Mycolicibacterium sphagni TaxID=1786 RepID=A0A255DK99_9MYCO|nr:hypothetical protein CG716_19470 [Mycolicibacterium sphagni]
MPLEMSAESTPPGVHVVIADLDAGRTVGTDGFGVFGLDLPIELECCVPDDPVSACAGAEFTSAAPKDNARTPAPSQA